MGEDTRQIERQIEAERSELGRNLHELEHRAKALTDWRVHYRNHTAVALGMAFGGGVLIGILTASSRNDNGRLYVGDTVEDLSPSRREPGRLRTMSAAAQRSAVGQQVKRQVEDVWHSIVDALVGVGAAKAVELIGKHVPGFREELDRRAASGSTGY